MGERVDARRVGVAERAEAIAWYAYHASRPAFVEYARLEIEAAVDEAVGGVVARETADALAEAVHACRWDVANPYETDAPILVAGDDWPVLVAGDDWKAVQRALAAYRRDAP